MTTRDRLLVLLLLCLSSVASAEFLTPGDHERNLTVDNRNRSYLVHIPPTYDKAKPTAIVIAFHGAMMNAHRMVSFTGLSDKADAAGFIVVYPNGVGLGNELLFFNASQPRQANGFPDDVAFTRKLVDDLKTVANVDFNASSPPA